MEILLKKEHIEDVDLENNLVSFYYIDNGLTLHILVSVNGVGDITYYKDNDPLMYGEYVYSTARESLSYELYSVFNEYGEAVDKSEYSIIFEDQDDISDYIESVLARQ